MFVCKKIFLYAPKDETLERLQSYVSRIRPPHLGKVTDNHFHIVLSDRRSRSHWGNRTILTYAFIGSVWQKESGSTINYYTYPGIANLIVGAGLFLGVLCSMRHLLSGANNHYVVGILSCALVLFLLWNIWEGRRCASEFEQIFGPQIVKE